MWFSSWLRNGKRSALAAPRRTQMSTHRRAGFRPRFEALEDRKLLSASGLPYPTAATVNQLIADINYANGAGGAITINLQPGTTFDLTSVNNTTDGGNALPVIGGARAVHLAIVGNGDTIERVSPNSKSKNDFHLFDVAPGASLALDNVVLQEQGLNYYSAPTIAVYNHGTLMVSNCAASMIYGYVLWNASGELTVTNSNLSGNDGGAIYNKGGTVAVSDSNLSNNLYGGGVSNDTGTMTISNCTLSGNTAAINGGNVDNNGGTVAIKDSTISGGSARYGGGICNAEGTVAIDNVTLSGNIATWHTDYPWTVDGKGGAIFNSSGTVTITSSTIKGNGAVGDGAGIYNDSRGTVKVDNFSSIAGNPNSFDGDYGLLASQDVHNLGVLYLDSTSKIRTLDGNAALEDPSGAGLPFWPAANVSQLIADINYANEAGADVTINLAGNTTFDLQSADNSTDGGNGLPVVGGAKAVNLTIVGNGDTIERVGSGYFRLLDVASGSSLTLDHVTLRGGSLFGSPFSQAASGFGGAIYNRGTLAITDSNLSGNTANGNAGFVDGGGIYNGGGAVTMTNSVLSDNTANWGNGGGIYNAGGSVLLSNSSLSGNVVYPPYSGGSGGYGGGIYNDAHGTVTVQSSGNITGNDSNWFGDPYSDDVYNVGVVYQDSTSTIGTLYGNPAMSLGANAPQLQIRDVTVTEGNTGTVAANFIVNLSAVSTQTIIVGFTTADGTATAGSDYQAASGNLTFAPGETSKTVTVLVNGDTSYEPDETFNVILSGATNATLGMAIATGTIQSDDALPSLAITDVASNEGNSGTTPFVFTVSLSAPSIQPITVAYATANGTATAGSGYKAASGTLTFAPGETSKTVTVLVSGDRLAEPNETYFVNLSAATNATIAIGQGTGTVVDDEPRISITDVSKLERKKGQTTLFTFTITLSTAYDQPVTMSFKTTNGTAKYGYDYTAKTGRLTFAPGVTTKTITIAVKGDSKKEANETFYVYLFGNSSNSLFTKSRGIGTILNDD